MYLTSKKKKKRAVLAIITYLFDRRQGYRGIWAACTSFNVLLWTGILD